MIETVFQKLVNSSVDGIFAFDRHYRFTVWNPVVEQLFGVPRAEVLQKNAFDVLPVLKTIGEDEFFAQALAGQTVVAKDRSYQHDQPGQTKYFETHYSPLFDDESTIVGGMAIIRDITDQKRTIDELAVLSEVSQAIGSSLDTTAILDKIIAHTTRLLQAAATSVALYDEEQGDLYFATAYGQNAQFVMGKRLALGTGIAGWVAQHGEPLLIPDTTADPRFFKDFDKAGGFSTRSILCVPLQTKGQTIGIIEAMNKKGGDFNHADLRLLSSLAASAAIAIENARLFEKAQQEIAERKRAEKALRQSESRYRRLFEDSPISLWEEDFSAVKTYLATLQQQQKISDLKTYLVQHPDIVEYCSTKIKVLDVNQVTLTMFEASTKQEMVGSLSRMFGPESYEQFIDVLVAIAQDTPRLDFEAINYTLTGQKINVAVNWTVAPGYEKNFAKVLVSVVDITKRKQTEFELQAYRDHLEQLVQERTAKLEQAVAEIAAAHDQIDAILHSVADGLIVTDLNYRIILANPAAEALLGSKLHEIVGREIGEAIKDENLRAAVHNTLQRQSRGYEVDVELKSQYNERQKVMRARTAPVVDGERGQAIGTVTLIQDVTRLSEINRLKSELLSTVAHELRTPLTSILGFSEILLTRTLDDERQNRYLSMINEQSANLTKVVNDLLDVSRLESGRPLDLKLEQVDMAKLIRDIVLPFQETAPDYNIQLQGVSDLPLVIGDPFRLMQVGRNLLSNAGRYSTSPGNIIVSASVIPGYLKISIQDEGIGMRLEEQDYLFEPFYRADASNTAQEGVGLGLAISKLIVEQHGGQIWIDSEWQVGTTVHFTVPLAEPENVDTN